MLKHDLLVGLLMRCQLYSMRLLLSFELCLQRCDHSRVLRLGLIYRQGRKSNQ
eukprot:COSAG05_NODE_90_length_20140_cov_25.117060_13_plen_53_part_00